MISLYTYRVETYLRRKSYHTTLNNSLMEGEIHEPRCMLGLKK